MVDQGSQLGRSAPFAECAMTAKIELEVTGTEAHNALGVGERYHQPLRNTYRKLRLTYPDQE